MNTSDILRQLESLPVADLEEIIAAAEEQRDARRENGKKELMEEFAAKAKALGVSLDDLFGNAPAKREPRMTAVSRKAAKSAADAKFRDPETGSTWSGRGRIPGWLKQAEASGRGRAEFAVG